MSNDFETDRIVHLEGCAVEVAYLSSALRILCWQLCESDIERGSRLDELRNAIMGIGRALEHKVQLFNE